jgi:hypothetical protein
MGRVCEANGKFNVFTGMVSLISPAVGDWPVSSFLPLPVTEYEKNIGGRVASRKCKIGKKTVTGCPHSERKHYAKNMCNGCYHKYGRKGTAWACEHSNRNLYAKGKCQNCYLRSYIKLRQAPTNMV